MNTWHSLLPALGIYPVCPCLCLEVALFQARVYSQVCKQLPFVQQCLSGFIEMTASFSGSVMKPKGSLTSSSSCVSTAGPLCASWKRSFFILRYCRLSSSLTASFVLWIKSINTVSGRSRRTNMCCRIHKQVSDLLGLQCTCFEGTIMSSSWVY